MSTNTQELVRSFTAVVGQDIKNKFNTVAQQALAGNEASLKMLPVIVGWLDTAIKQTADGAPNLNVPIAGATSNHAAPNGFGQANALSGFVANVGPQAQQGFAPQQQQQFGQQQFGGPQQPQGGVAPPKDSKLSLQECGTARVPNHMSLPTGAKCGVAHTSNSCPGATLYCDKPATKQGTCGSWTCTGHAKRETADAKGKGGKKSAGSAVTSAQQIVGMQTPSYMPAGFGQNPAMVNNVTGLMQQQPHAPTPFGQFGQQPANPALSNQLANSMQNQVGAIPQSNPVAPGGGFNFNTVLAQPATSAVPINPAFGSVPSTPQAPQGQFGGQQVGFGAPQQGFAQFGQAPAQAPIGFGQFGQTPVNIQPQLGQVQGFQEDDEAGSSDDESSEGEEPTPIPVTNPADIAAVNAAAGLAPPQVSFGQPAQPMVSFGQPAVNPLQAAVAIQQQQQAPAPAAEPINPLLAMTNAALAPK